jgi:hypothetical protein
MIGYQVGCLKMHFNLLLQTSCSYNALPKWQNTRKLQTVTTFFVHRSVQTPLNNLSSTWMNSTTIFCGHLLLLWLVVIAMA